MTIANHYQAGWEKVDFLQIKEKKKNSEVEAFGT